MKSFIIAVCTAALLSSCAANKPQSPTEKDQIASLKKSEEEKYAADIRSRIKPATTQEREQISKAIERNLIDPESSRYRDIYVAPNDMACVEVNSKNKFGGYQGFALYAAKKIQGTWYSLGPLDNPKINFKITMDLCLSSISNNKD